MGGEFTTTRHSYPKQQTLTQPWLALFCAQLRGSGDDGFYGSPVCISADRAGFSPTQTPYERNVSGFRASNGSRQRDTCAIVSTCSIERLWVVIVVNAIPCTGDLYRQCNQHQKQPQNRPVLKNGSRLLASKVKVPLMSKIYRSGRCVERSSLRRNSPRGATRLSSVK